VFLLNSRQSHFTATFQHFGYPNARRYPFSRSYGVMLPSSLTRVLPFALVYSTHLPVSDCGTGTPGSSLRGFSGQFGSTTCALKARHRASARRTDLPIQLSPTRLAPDTLAGPNYRLADRSASPLRSPEVVPECRTVVHSLRLTASAKARLTRRGLTLRRKPEIYGEHGSHVFYATHVCILTSARSSRPYGRPSLPAERSPTTGPMV
jgi:hypothetical protein